MVSFAGRVGPSSAVTIVHADGLRTSYSYLASVAVSEGAVVIGGQPIGRSGLRLHFGVRRGDTYLDPATLFEPRVGAVPVKVRLVPLGGG